MIYMETVFACLATPLFIAAFLLKGEIRRFIVFFVLGLLVCLFTAYINSYAASVLAVGGYASLTVAQTMVQVTPICEEVMKALPVFAFAAIYRPKRKEIAAVSIAVGLGFAIFENICYITRYGADDFLLVLIRGLSAGVMHAVCAAILGYGYALIYRRGRLAASGAFALLCVSSTYHAVYNLMVMADGAWRTAGYLLPLATAAIILFFVMWWEGSLHTEN